MVKTITIGDKSLNLKASLYTAHKYKQDTGKNLLTTLDRMSNAEQDSDATSNIVEELIYITYLMNCEYNNQYVDYDTWLKDFDGVLDNNDWIIDVAMLAATPFRKSQANPTRK